MEHNNGPRLVSVAIALGAVAMGGIVVGLVLARHRRQRASVEPAATADTDSGAAECLDATGGRDDPAGGVPADMRPHDPSYGPLI